MEHQIYETNRKPLLCLDIEGTLISNAVSQIPRPGLYSFLESVYRICELALYTSVSPERLQSIKGVLIREKTVPPWFIDLPSFHPKGTIKFKAECGRSDAMLLDDQATVVAPGEEDWWIPIEEFVPPYTMQDRELFVAFANIESRLLGD